MIEIVLIRHAPTEWNDAGRIQGRSDIELSARGRTLASDWALPARFRAFDWVTSPLARARETARFLGAPDGAPTDIRLAEADWGDWEGRVLAELRAELGEELTRNEARGLDLQPPNGESPRDVRTRFAAWVGAIAEAGRPTIAVTHNGVIRAAYSLATDWDMREDMDERVRWGTANLFEVASDGTFAVRQLNIELGAAGETRPG